MRKIYKVIALFLVVVLAFSVICVGFASENSATKGNKLTETLLSKFETSRSDTVTAMIWLTDIDTSPAEIIALDEVGMTKDELTELNINNDRLSLTADTSSAMSKVQSYIKAKRDTLSKMYTDYNKRVVGSLLTKDSIIYISRLSPVVIAELSKDVALSVAKSNNVQLIDYYEEKSEVQAANTEDDGSTPTSLNRINSITRANGVTGASSNYGYTGAGVKIGMIDTHIPGDLTYLNGVNYTVISPEATIDLDKHPEQVLFIMNSIASDAEYFLAGIGGGGQTKIMEEVESLVADYYVNIINSSYTFTFGSESADTNPHFNGYGNASKWIDHIAYQHNVHFVTSSGNYGGTLGVPSSAMAYNAVTVGNIYVKNSMILSNHELWTGEVRPSSYYDYSEDSVLDAAFKPDLCAPGAGLETSYGKFGGTSASAPQVSAAIALMCEQRPALLTQQKTVKAILAASVNFDSPKRFVPGTDGYMMYGAGLLDCVGACWVVGNYRYTTGSMPANGTDRTHTFTVTSSDSRIRVALSWNIKSLYNTSSNSSSEHDNQYAYDESLPDLNLKIKDPNGNYVKAADGSDLCSSTTNNNVEILDFVPTMTGTYTIVVICGDNVTRTVPYSLAWR